MAKFDSGKASNLGGVNIKAQRGDSLNAIRFDSNIATTPTSANDVLLYRRSNTLRFWDGSSETTLGGSGAGATPTWETIFAADATFTITPGTTFTIAGNHADAVDVLTLTNIGGGSGDVIQITNSGTGNDIQGTSNTWKVTKAGVATVAGISISGTASALATTGAAVWTLLDNSATSLSIGSTGATSLLVLNTTNGSETVTVGNNLTVTDGLTTLTSTSNTVQNLLVTNNTATTWGASAASAGIAVLRSTSLTTGTLLKLQLTESALAGGYYLECFDVTGGAAVATIGEDGAHVIAGVGGSDMLTVTAGDALLSDGSLTITDADNAATVSVTNNTATTATVFAIAGSGAFTGSTTTSFLTLTPSGLTTGTALYIAAAAATTASVLADFTTSTTTGTVLRLTASGVEVDGAATGVLTMVADSATTAGATAGRGLVSLSADALTTGTGVDITSTALGLAAGELLNVEHICSGTITAAKTGQLVDITSSRTHTAATAISDDYDALSIIRTSVNTNAGGTLNATGSVLYIQNVATPTAGTLADTVNGLEVVMDADGTGDGVKITHSAITGKALEIVSSGTTAAGVILLTANSVDSGQGILVNANALTTGQALSIAHTTTVITTGSVAKISSTSVDTGTGQGTLLDLVSSGTTAGLAVKLTTAAITGGTAMSIVADALTTGTGLLLSSAGVLTTTGEILSVVGNSATTCTGLVRISGTALTDGFAIQATGGGAAATASGGVVDIVAGAATLGSALRVATTGVYTGTTGVVNIDAASATEGVIVDIGGAGLTTGTALKINATEATLTTGKYLDCYDGAATDFSVARYGATTIAGNAALTAALTITKGDLLMSDGVLRGAVSATVTADAGSVQGGSPITRSLVEVATCATSGDSVTLPGAAAGQIVIITNHGVNSADVFPASGDAINEAAADTAKALAANATMLCYSYDGTNWEALTLAR